MSYEDYLVKLLKDPEECAVYLNAALEEDDMAVFMLALKDVVKALGEE